MTTALKEHPLENLPKLWQWYRAKPPNSLNHPAEILLWNVVRGLVTPGKEGARAWLQGIDQFVRCSVSPRDDFLIADSLSQEMGSPLADHLSHLGETSIRADEGERAKASLVVLANKVNLSAIRFLAAWAALNVGDLETCIDECEKEIEPHAPMYTLLGQALLESGRSFEAIDALKVAIKLDTQDALALFQLVKAYLVVGNTRDAADAANRCRVVTGRNVEIECLSAMVVLTDRARNLDFAEQTLDRLGQFFREDPGNLDLMTLTFDVADMKGDQIALANLFRTADITSLARRADFLSKMTMILKKLGDRQWFGLSQQLADKILTISNVHCQMSS